MALVQSEVRVAADPLTVWERITDWRSHSRWVPLTTVTIDSSSPATSGLGTRFTGRTHLGRLGFNDPMRVTVWQPPTSAEPGRCRVIKQGPWLTGWAQIDVRAESGGTLVRWTEDVAVRGVPKRAAPVIARTGALLFGRTLKRLAAELSASVSG